MKTPLLFLLVATLVSLQALAHSPAPEPVESKLILMGGGTKPHAALQKLSEWAGKKDAKILVITWATTTPSETFQAFKKEMSAFEPKEVIEAIRAEQLPLQREALAKQILDSTAVFFVGGDQNRIMNVLDRDAPLVRLLKTRYSEGTVFGGTSAGTAIMSEAVMAQELDASVIDPAKILLRRGLGLLPAHIYIDQHFVKRQRTNRMLSVLTGRPGLYGMGINEGAAVAITANKTLDSLEGQTLLFDTVAVKDSVVLKILEPSERNFELQ